MFKCTVCGKSYKTRTTLTRHAHNHTGDANHTCEHCGVAFARKDILNRHLRQGHVDEFATARQRTHTACEPCRIARLRCDGDEPCRRCDSSQKHCMYSLDSRRISKANQRRKRGKSTDAEEMPGPSGSLPSPTVASNGELNDIRMDDGLQSDLMLPTAGDNPGDTALQTYTDELEAAFSNARDGRGLDLPVDLDGMSWPWLHEALFLQDDPLAGLFDGGGTSQDVLDDGIFANATDVADLNVPIPELNTPVSQMPGASTEEPEANTSLADMVNELVDFATKATSEGASRLAKQSYWRTAGSRLRYTLASQDPLTSSGHLTPHILHQMIAVHYLPKFNRLWPMFSQFDFDADALNPLLYLVLVSIGSMYGSDHQKLFGTSLHKRLRRLLGACLFDLEGPEGDMTWLAHARLLTQVQGLYFGQKQSFSYAQHLGALLAAQSRRLNLFKQPEHGRTQRNYGDDSQELNELASWKQIEYRKRLAFGIMRADVYTSVLLNSRPLLSYEEIHLDVPQSERLWHNLDGLTPREQLLTFRTESRYRPQVMFPDLVRILLERNEKAPLSDAWTYELCLFGLQLPLWRFSHDPDLFPRLTGTTWTRDRPLREQASEGPTIADPIDPLEIDNISAPIHTSLDSLGPIHRRMSDLRSERERVEIALESWHDSFLTARRSPGFAHERDSLMSSLLLWHFSYLRLHAPLAQLHNVSYRAGENWGSNDKTLLQIRQWATTPSASIATEKAISICDLLSQEINRPLELRASFNFLAFGSLHHSAVVLWTMSEIGSQNGIAVLGKPTQSSTFACKLQNGDTCNLLMQCSTLFKDLSSLGGASFGSAAENLSKSRFPTL